MNETEGVVPRYRECTDPFIWKSEGFLRPLQALWRNPMLLWPPTHPHPKLLFLPRILIANEGVSSVHPQVATRNGFSSWDGRQGSAKLAIYVEQSISREVSWCVCLTHSLWNNLLPFSQPTSSPLKPWGLHPLLLPPWLFLKDLSSPNPFPLLSSISKLLTFRGFRLESNKPNLH